MTEKEMPARVKLGDFGGDGICSTVDDDGVEYIRGDIADLSLQALGMCVVLLEQKKTLPGGLCPMEQDALAVGLLALGEGLRGPKGE